MRKWTGISLLFPPIGNSSSEDQVVMTPVQIVCLIMSFNQDIIPQSIMFIFISANNHCDVRDSSVKSYLSKICDAQLLFLSFSTTRN